MYQGFLDFYYINHSISIYIVMKNNDTVYHLKINKLTIISYLSFALKTSITMNDLVVI